MLLTWLEIVMKWTKTDRKTFAVEDVQIDLFTFVSSFLGKINYLGYFFAEFFSRNWGPELSIWDGHGHLRANKFKSLKFLLKVIFWSSLADLKRLDSQFLKLINSRATETTLLKWRNPGKFVRLSVKRSPPWGMYLETTVFLHLILAIR